MPCNEKYLRENKSSRRTVPQERVYVGNIRKILQYWPMNTLIYAQHMQDLKMPSDEKKNEKKNEKSKAREKTNAIYVEISCVCYVYASFYENCFLFSFYICIKCRRNMCT